MKYLILIAFAIACNKQEREIKVNKFEASFVIAHGSNYAKYTIYASTNGIDFVPVKYIIPEPGTKTQYTIQFAIPADKMDANGKVLFYLEKAAESGEVSRTEIVTVQ